ncbi:hypothetical protein [Gemmiger sp. An194]|uniref:hypothetical protein n=1 Tax=Gemmiger sp. An194 TaxID=1965582 RepID=UPI000B365417|nr:hypothetical protein [Gemmiger sp. An194]OUP23429.1 hypothetical protein B5F28_11435 [Gemmiger sp. An194]
MDILVVDDNDISFVWDAIQKLQLIFHPSIAPFGKFDYGKFFKSKAQKPCSLFLDRNILISLFKLCEQGELKNRAEAQRVALIMAWAALNGMEVSSGLAVMERASQLQCQKSGLLEIQRFQEIMSAYSAQLWVALAEGRITKIPPITFSQALAQNITVDYAAGGDHYDMALASLLHAVWLYRDKKLSAAEKVREFFQWTCDNLLIGEYMLVYVTLLFAGCENIKAPQNANSKDIEKVIAGCENQAWDISYLTNWSVFYEHPDDYPEEFMFATNDVLLKRIFIYKNNPHGWNGVLFNVFSKKEYGELIEFIEKNTENRKRPDFGEDSHKYFQLLIDDEKKRLKVPL